MMSYKGFLGYNLKVTKAIWILLTSVLSILQSQCIRIHYSPHILGWKPEGHQPRDKPHRNLHLEHRGILKNCSQSERLDRSHLPTRAGCFLGMHIQENRSQRKKDKFQRLCMPKAQLSFFYSTVFLWRWRRDTFMGVMQFYFRALDSVGLNVLHCQMLWKHHIEVKFRTIPKQILVKSYFNYSSYNIYQHLFFVFLFKIDPCWYTSSLTLYYFRKVMNFSKCLWSHKIMGKYQSKVHIKFAYNIS